MRLALLLLLGCSGSSLAILLAALPIWGRLGRADPRWDWAALAGLCALSVAGWVAALVIADAGGAR